MEPVFKKFHFQTEYKGKRPEDAPVRLKRSESPRETLERQLKEAVDREDYEKAAVLKKQIEQMQEAGNDE